MARTSLGRSGMTSRNLYLHWFAIVCAQALPSCSADGKGTSGSETSLPQSPTGEGGVDVADARADADDVTDATTDSTMDTGRGSDAMMDGSPTPICDCSEPNALPLECLCGSVPCPTFAAMTQSQCDNFRENTIRAS